MSIKNFGKTPSQKKEEFINSLPIRPRRGKFIKHSNGFLRGGSWHYADEKPPKFNYKKWRWENEKGENRSL